MYGTFYWTWDIPYILNTTITIFNTKVWFKSWNIVQFVSVKHTYNKCSREMLRKPKHNVVTQNLDIFVHGTFHWTQ